MVKQTTTDGLPQTTTAGRRIAKLALLLTIVGSLASTWLISDDRRRQNEFLEAARSKAHSGVDRAVHEVGDRLGSLKPLAEALVEQIESQTMSPLEIVGEMERIIHDHPQVYEIGLAAEPYTVDSDDASFSPSFDRKSGSVRKSPRAPYDYRDADNPATEWYRQALTAEGPIWQEPYCDGFSCYAEYAIPFRFQDDVPAGVVYINMHPSGLGELLESLDLGSTGYGIILSQQGRLVSHPNTSWVYEGKTLLQLAEQSGDAELARLAAKAMAGAHGVTEHIDPESGQASWLFYQQIPGTDWSMVVVYLLDQIYRQRDALFYSRNLILGLTLLSTVFFFGLFIAARLVNRFGAACLWGVSILTSLLFVIAIAVVWRAVLSGARDPQLRQSIQSVVDNPAEQRDADLEVKQRSVQLVHRNSVNSYLSDLQALASAAGQPAPVHLETGVFIQSLEFENPYNVFVTGYIWQKLLKDTHQGIVPGFKLPEAVDPKIELAFEHPLPDADSDGAPDGKFMGWYFEALLRQSFDYSEYPFDDKSIWLRLWPRELRAPVILTPLFESYSQIKPSMLPGVENDFVLPGWQLQESYFSLRRNIYNVSLGSSRVNDHQAMPELYFHIDIRREFMNAFISNLVPLISVVFILYTLLLIITYDAQRAELHGFDTAQILGSAAALFFSVLIGHVQLRGQFQVQEVMYLEYFYFVVYLLILGVSLNALIFCWSSDDATFIRRHDNLFMKLAYWPLILGALCAITLWTFS